jgi:hypothetical protein
MVFWERFSPSKICRTISREHERTLAHFAPGTCLTTYGKAAEPFTVITTPQFGDRETSTLLSSPIDLAHRTPPTHSPTEVVALGMRKGFGKREVGKKRERGQDVARVLNGSLIRGDVNDHQDGSGYICYVWKATAVQGQSSRHKDMPRMHWYNYLGWMLGGVFILFFGVGIFAGIDESQAIIPILVILALGAGVILVNKD